MQEQGSGLNGGDKLGCAQEVGLTKDDGTVGCEQSKDQQNITVDEDLNDDGDIDLIQCTTPVNRENHGSSTPMQLNNNETDDRMRQNDEQSPRRSYINGTCELIHNQRSAFIEPVKSGIQGYETTESFINGMNQWQWFNIDGERIPVIVRSNERYAAVHIVQLKLLSKFPPQIPDEMATRYTMVSHKMTYIEACIFNTINAVLCNFELGCQLFTIDDEVVRLNDVLQFYWSVKSYNLTRILDIYNNELRNASSTQLIALFMQIARNVQMHLQVSSFFFCYL